MPEKKTKKKKQRKKIKKDLNFLSPEQRSRLIEVKTELESVRPTDRSKKTRIPSHMKTEIQAFGGIIMLQNLIGQILAR